MNSACSRMAFRAFLLLGLFSWIPGCTLRPESAPWSNDQRIIGPQVPPSEGMLLVETEVSGSPEEGETPHERFHVYDSTGRNLTYFNNDNSSPVSLPVGRYVVVSKVLGQQRRVQVEIKKGCLTQVSLNDFKEGPVIE